MLSRAVVLDGRGVRPAFELLLGRRRFREQAPHRLELLGAREVRRARDRDLRAGEVHAGTHERERLDRLRRAAEVGDEQRIARGPDHRSVPNGDGVHDVACLDELAAHDLDEDGLHGGGD